ncbi:MAG TPA: diacylglycerol kinase family protein [Ktedonobacteraceae bacterium]|jgi:YegS/Rv2252/BmrU family lipid kinase|nr:diacylglycerol kinase family protein [Ktedonobacteraceae bacterium]
MRSKKASLVINPRAGENLAKLTDILAILSAAGMKTDIKLKEYGGQTLELAAEAAEDNSDLVIAYGGDGTVNQVVNGVMNVKGQHSIVGVIPGGTANVWASEVGIPGDAARAALALVESEVRKVDIGHVDIESFTLSGAAQNNGGSRDAKAMRKIKASSKGRHHFLLMAGLGIDADIMQHVSKPLKYEIGRLAVGLSAAKELPKQQPFPVEIRAANDTGKDDLVWQGEALQVVIGNTRKYASILEMTPGAYIDDGILDVCVITAGDPLTTIQQITSLLLRRKPDNLTAEYFHGAHLSISVPASIHLQLDGSAVQLKDYLGKSDCKVLKQFDDADQIMVSYSFDAMPRALRVAIPASYNNTLFEHPHGKAASQSESEDQTGGQQTASHSEDQSPAQEQAEAENSDQEHDQPGEWERQQMQARVNKLIEEGRKVTVVGVAHKVGKKETYIIAGGTTKKSTGETRPVAVRVNGNTTVLRKTGEAASPSVIQELQEGCEIVVEGKKSKRGVIAAKQIVV